MPTQAQKPDQSIGLSVNRAWIYAQLYLPRPFMRSRERRLISSIVRPLLRTSRSEATMALVRGPRANTGFEVVLDPKARFTVLELPECDPIAYALAGSIQHRSQFSKRNLLIVRGVWTNDGNAK